MTAEPRQLRLRYPAVCATCGTALRPAALPCGMRRPNRRIASNTRRVWKLSSGQQHNRQRLPAARPLQS